ncbi:AAA family ATPase [Bosea sp. WAO]|uniref:AAA family ATPase n=1 Tax=Bosea sp. WAO TaxID=406341 RepID=UPI0009FAE454|nr:AAA family ATPase [Bosea sp. WAO]
MPRGKPSVADRHSIPARKDLLARAYIEILAREAGAKIQPMLRADCTDEALERLIDDLEDSFDGGGVSILRPDLAAVAVLIARAIEGVSGLARRIRRDAPIVVLTTHSPNLVEMAKEVAQSCVLPSHSRVMEAGSIVGSQTRAVLVARDGSAREDRPEKGNKEITAALQRRIPVMGIAPDPTRHLPQALMRTAEFRLVLPTLDQTALALVIDVVTGRAPSRAMDPDLIRLLDVDDLPLAFRFGRAGDACLAAIEDVVRKKGEYLIQGPSLSELAGYGAAREWGLQLADDLSEYRAGKLSWADLDHKGLLLSGPPGVGKTQFARALAKSARVPLVSTSVAQWNAAPFLSGTLQAIRDAFSQARRQAPSILFIDELDGISDRSKLQGDYVEYWTQIVNLLLEQLAGIEERPGVVVIAATNHPDRIDAAIKRAGRLDREIQIDRPDTAALVEIFRYYIGAALPPSTNLTPLALASRGATGADVEALVRGAKGTARRARRDLTLDELLSAIAANAPALSPDARWRIAVHESGHALAAHELEAGSVCGISLHSRGGFFEFESNLTGSATYDRFQSEIIVLMAGRAAERLILGDASAGAGMSISSDLARATGFAMLVETQCGLGISGSAYLAEIRNLAQHPELHKAVNEHLNDAEDKARLLLDRKRGRLIALANALAAQGYLSGDDIKSIVEVGPVELSEAQDEFGRCA